VKLGPSLLDAAMGTALQAVGLPPDALPEAWLLDRPAAVEAVHRSHATAGAAVLLTCTFNLAGPRLEQAGLGERVEELAAAAIRLARSAAPRALVAGAVGPTALAGPGKSPAAEELSERYRRAFGALAAAGADLLWSETQYDLGEARLALAAARAAGLPAAATMSFAVRVRVLVCPDGTPAEDCLRALAGDGALAVGVNCVAPGPWLAALVERAAPTLGVPLALKPNAGPPGRELQPVAFATALAPAAGAGAVVLGGCCGTTAAHLLALRGLLPRPQTRG
jgi:5-methyltetrahydrofolate--homocysteine methyltransferase